MKLLVNNLPSGGYGYSSDKSDIELLPLTFSELLKYTSHKYDENISSLIWDMEHLIHTIDGWEYLSAFDITSIIFMRKYISATFENELMINVGDSVYKLNVADISFKELKHELKSIDTVEIDTSRYLFRIPTMKEFYYACKHAESIDPDMEIGLVYLCSSLVHLSLLPSNIVGNHSLYTNLLNDNRCHRDSDINNEVNRRFDMAYKDVTNAVHEDIILSQYLIDLLMDKYNDVTVKSEGGESVVSINKLTTDIFRFIQCNVPSIDSKINYIEEV